jgi:hypothetical protein
MKTKLRNLYGRLPVIRDLLSIKAELNHRWPYDRLMAASSAIRAIEAIKAGNERYRDPRRLLTHGAQYFSQNFEDGMIAEIFRRIGTTNRTFLEIGVGNGSENNTASLLSAGWSGFWIEGDVDCVGSIESQLLKMPKISKRLKVQQTFVSPDNIAGLLSEMGVPDEIDLFSLDIDLNTYHIWAALEGFRPRVVVVEYNAAFPPGLEWIHPYSEQGGWDYTQDFGASLKAFELMGKKHGYSLVGCDITGINAFFVRDDMMGDHFEGEHTAENHYEPPRYSLTHRYGHPSVFFVENQAG